jgi:hypothetical protein
MATRRQSTLSRKTPKQSALLTSQRTHLRNIVLQLNIVQAAVICAAETIANQTSDCNPEAALLLQRCASDRLHVQIEALAKLAGRPTRS